MTDTSGRRLAGFAVIAACSFSFLSAATIPARAQNESDAADGDWLWLFAGRDLDAFTPIGDGNWRIVDNIIEADAGTGQLLSKMSFGDFELVVEFWVSPDANSGVFLRCDSRETIDPNTCYEVNIFDQRPDQTYRTGGIVNVAAPSQALDTGNRWNTYRIVARGSRLTITLNGVETVDVENEAHSQGPLSLQYGAGTVKFRNVRIRSL